MVLPVGTTRGGEERAYRRREPQESALYRLLAQHLETFLAQAAADGAGLPRFVERELRAFLACGLLCHGFVRVPCRTRGKDALVAFSCRGRGFCPSCSGRRMAETAAHLEDRVLPYVLHRQWVLTFPWQLRYLLAFAPDLCAAVRRIFLRVVFAWHRARAAERDVPAGSSVAVVFPQRFGSALNLNPHFHAFFIGTPGRTGPPSTQEPRHVSRHPRPGRFLA